MSTLVEKILQDEFKRRRKKNPRYSLRAYARSLGVSSGRLSELLTGKRKLSTKMLERIIDQIAVSDSVRRQLFDESGLARKRTATIAEDHLRSIADWYHFAVMSLAELDESSASPEWIAARLGITKKEANDALNRLVRIGLLKIESVRGEPRLVPQQKETTTSHDVPSWALRESHRQSLEQTIAALEEIPVELRDISSMTMAIDIDQIAQAKKEIRTFRRRLCRLLEAGKKNEIYNLNIQLVPVTRLSKPKQERDLSL